MTQPSTKIIFLGPSGTCFFVEIKSKRRKAGTAETPSVTPQSQQQPIINRADDLLQKRLDSNAIQIAKGKFLKIPSADAIAERKKLEAELSKRPDARLQSIARVNRRRHFVPSPYGVSAHTPREAKDLTIAQWANQPNNTDRSTDEMLLFQPDSETGKLSLHLFLLSR